VPVDQIHANMGLSNKPLERPGTILMLPLGRGGAGRSAPIR
jgi:hypothetical protein